MENRHIVEIFNPFERHTATKHQSIGNEPGQHACLPVFLQCNIRTNGQILRPVRVTVPDCASIDLLNQCEKNGLNKIKMDT
jgi:hypothetical protein